MEWLFCGGYSDGHERRHPHPIADRIGDPSAAELLLPLIYKELRSLAAAKMAHESPDDTLQATALVHEAYLRLVDDDQPQHGNHEAISLRPLQRPCDGYWWRRRRKQGPENAAVECNGKMRTRI